MQRKLSRTIMLKLVLFFAFLTFNIEESFRNGARVRVTFLLYQRNFFRVSVRELGATIANAKAVAATTIHASLINKPGCILLIAMTHPFNNDCSTFGSLFLKNENPNAYVFSICSCKDRISQGRCQVGFV